MKLSKESVGFLNDELLSIVNMLRLALLAVENEEDELLPTAIETAYAQLQGLVDEFCIRRRITKSWRPEGWENPYDLSTSCCLVDGMSEERDVSIVDSQQDCYEAGADAMLKALRKRKKETPYNPWDYIPDDEEGD